MALVRSDITGYNNTIDMIDCDIRNTVHPHCKMLAHEYMHVYMHTYVHPCLKTASFHSHVHIHTHGCCGTKHFHNVKEEYNTDDDQILQFEAPVTAQ